MEPGGSMPHLQGLSNNPYPEPNHPNYPHWYILILSSHLRLGLPKSFFPAGVPVESTPTFFHYGYMGCPSQSSRLNHPHYIR